MKRTQRNFVVEFKSSRRHPTPPVSSIWGNTDFKALAREVESISPQLFKPVDPTDDVPAPSVVTPREARVLDPIFQKFEDASTPETEATAPADIPAENEPVLGEAPLATHETVAAVNVSDSMPLRKSARPIHKRGTRRRSVDAGKNSSALARIELTPTSLEDLDLLEAENKHLRTLLAKKLRAENKQLAMMLRRFGIS